MKFKRKPALRIAPNEVIFQTKFAWLPVYCEFDETTVWLEHYTEVLRYSRASHSLMSEIKFGERYYLVAGNTRLSTAAALGMTPMVLIGELKNY
jgi:hypothetical protein